jgi:hypothetical protein
LLLATAVVTVVGVGSMVAAECDDAVDDTTTGAEEKEGIHAAVKC